MSKEQASNLSEYTVTELSGSIKRTIESGFSHVRVRGEISGFRGPHSSGHAYFSIKDERARMDAVVWKGLYNRLKFKPEEGMEMIATGKVTTYPGSSKYQIVIEQLEPAGAGALMALLEERKKMLAAEGLFDDARKQLLPYMPRVIGVVTSPTGAVIRDILHRIADRFPVKVITWPVRVQGETSGDEVARAINGFNALDASSDISKPELIIVARGGGSLEDLWGFNDEAVVRAASKSDIPLISAVGHETDWTLLDLVADRRAPTPTGAAEMAVPVKADLDSMIANLNARMLSASSRIIEQRRQNFQALSRGIPSLDNLLALPRRRIDEVSNLLGKAIELNVMNRRRALETSSARLTPISLQASLQDRNARLVQNAKALAVNWDRIKEQKTTQMSRINRALSPVPQQITQRIQQFHNQIEQSRLRIDGAINRQISQGRQQLVAQDRVLQSLAYKNVLNRGYAIVRDVNNKPITAAKTITAQQHLSVEFSDGAINVVETGEAPAPTVKAKQTPKTTTKPKDKQKNQGSLF